MGSRRQPENSTRIRIEQRRTQHPSQARSKTLRLQGDEEGCQKKYGGVSQLQAAAAAQQGAEHFKGGAGCAGDGQTWTDGQVDQHGKDLCKYRVDPACQLRQPASLGCGNDPQHRQKDGTDCKACKGKPEVYASLCPQIGRED